MIHEIVLTEKELTMIIHEWLREQGYMSQKPEEIRFLVSYGREALDRKAGTQTVTAHMSLLG